MIIPQPIAPCIQVKLNTNPPPTIATSVQRRRLIQSRTVIAAPIKAINHTLESISRLTSTLGDSPINNVFVSLSSRLISSSSARKSHSVEHGFPPSSIIDLQYSES